MNIYVTELESPAHTPSLSVEGVCAMNFARFLNFALFTFLIITFIEKTPHADFQRSNPFSNHHGHYEILSAEKCIQNDYPAYCPWEKVQITTDGRITCLKFTVESSLQHYCFESLEKGEVQGEFAKYSLTPFATWDFQKIISDGERFLRQVVFEVSRKDETEKEEKPLLRIDEYSFVDGPEQQRIRVDKKIHLRLRQL